MRLEYQRPRRPAQSKSLWWWLAVSAIAAVFVTPFVVAAIAVLGLPLIRAIRNF